MESSSKRHSETLKLHQLIGSGTVVKKVHSTIIPRTMVNCTKEQLWHIFSCQFEQLTEKKFEKTAESIANISAIFYYFLRDEKFLTHPNLRADLSKPSFGKGLLIVGGYGIGKTDYMKALELCFILLKYHRFKIFSTNSLVQEFENCETPSDKKAFYNRMNLGVNLFDDITTERVANNYGHVNLLKEILEERYMLNKLTHATANYQEGGEKTPEAALLYIAECYGSRLYDRLFEMFNIVVFDGKSFRR